MYPESTPRLDYTVMETHNSLTLGIVDTSLYPVDFNVVSPTYEITPPSFNKVTIGYQENNTLIVNSNTLNITCVTDVKDLIDLPDGIWTIRQSISPASVYVIEKSFLRTTKLEREFGSAFLKLDISDGSSDSKKINMKILDQVHFYMQSAIAAGNQCNNVLAMRMYNLAKKTLKTLCKNC